MIRILNVLRIAEGASWTNRLQRLMTSHNRNKKLVSADVNHRRPVSCRRTTEKNIVRSVLRKWEGVLV